MPLTNATLQALGTELASLITHISLHNADPGSDGSNEITGDGYARQAVTLSVDADGDLTLPSTESFSGPADEPVHSIGFWSADTGGTFRGSSARSGDATFSSGGQYNVTAGTITGTSGS